VSAEACTRLRCFGGDCAVLVSGSGPHGHAPAAVDRARRQLLEWHTRFSRFISDSELSRLNRDPRSAVPASAVMLALVAASLEAARLTDGLIDPTVLPALRAAGYSRSREDSTAPAAIALSDVLAGAPAREPAAAHPRAAWRQVSVDTRARVIVRPPGLELDLGGIAKGVFGDLLAVDLTGHDSFAVDAAGDVRFGGADTLPRPIAVSAPGGDCVLHTFHAHTGAVATSGIGRRAWRDGAGRPAHHLIDPASGRPAFTGLVQVTALAPTGALAETRAKAALLGGPARAARWLPDGGAIVADDGTLTVIDVPVGSLKTEAAAEVAIAA
jgi:thiamine biosynthesis lipoprotein